MGGAGGRVLAMGGAGGTISLTASPTDTALCAHLYVCVCMCVYRGMSMKEGRGYCACVRKSERESVWECVFG